MNLRRQTLVFLGGTLVVLAGSAALLSYSYFRPEFLALERNSALLELRNLSGLLFSELDAIENTNADWAVWDQANGFLLGLDSTFIGREIVPETFDRLELDRIAFFDVFGEPVGIVGESNGELVLYSDSIDPAFTNGGILSRLAASAADSAGLMRIGSGIAYVSIHNVMASDGTGPRSGSLAMIRIIEEAGGTAPVAVVGNRRAWISYEGKDSELPLDSIVVTGDGFLVVAARYGCIDGSDVILNLEIPRTIYTEAESILKHFIFLTVFGGLLFSAVTIALLQILVVKRLSRLLKLINVSGAPENGTSTHRLDEVSRIGMAIGPVLERLESMTSVLRRSEQNNAAILKAIPDYMITMTRNGVITSVKPGYGFESPFSPAKVIGMRIDEFELVDITLERLQEIVSRVLAEGSVESVSFGIRGSAETTFYDSRVVAFGQDSVLMIVRDVTQRMKAEEAAARLQRLESLGLLAGGIAHDFNNKLSTAIGSIELALANGPGGWSTVVRDLERALDACGSAGELTRKLLTFSSGGSPVFRPLSVHDLAISALEPLFKGIGVSLRIDIRPGTWLLDGDEEQLVQVFRNIATNALDALGGFGWFEVRASNSVDPTFADLPTGHYVTVEFLDSGPGIREELLKKVFEPYFTTREDAAGLGLSMCHSIAVKHGGWLEAFPGPGGRLCLTIPAIIETPEVPETITSAAMGGTGRLLVMDDDLQVLETIKEMLEALDYYVETASDGGQALHMIAEAYRTGRPYDLLILDLVVPGGIGGLETLSRARSRFGDVRAVVSSGYSSDSVLSEFGVHGFKAALRKPFNLEELSSTVRRLINIPEGGSRHDDRGRS